MISYQPLKVQQFFHTTPISYPFSHIYVLFPYNLTNFAHSPIWTMVMEGFYLTAVYIDLFGSVDEGHFIIFDHKGETTRDGRIWHENRNIIGNYIIGLT